MANIGIIAPTEQLFDLTLSVAREMGMQDDVIVRLGNLAEGVAVAREMETDGVQIIISRGGTAEFIARAGVRVPVISIALTCQELSQVVYDAKSITALARPRIAFVCSDNLNQDVELFAQVLGIDFSVHLVVGTYESTLAAIARAREEGADIVIGGTFVIEAAEKAGFKTVLLPSSGNSIRLALEEAKKMLYAVELERERTQRFKTLVGHIREGVLYVDLDGRVRIANPAAEAMLGKSVQELCASAIGEIMPIPGIAECLRGEVDALEELVRLNDVLFIATVIPAHVGRDLSGIIISLQETARIAQMDQEIRKTQNKHGLAAQYTFNDIWGISPAIRKAKRIASDYAATNSTILIFGETGTGKELFAQSVHNISHCANGPFVAVNCAALPPSLLESELFGYDKGAFTGANSRGKQGLIELAHGGTLFLDEVSEMDQYGQVRLLRFLQEKRIMRLGGDRYLPVNVRVIAASNRDLDAMVREGKFRQDLYYRLKVLMLDIPPLRERQGDVAHLSGKMLAEWENQLGYRITFVPEVTNILVRYSWPGNVRELVNVLENLIVVGRRKVITPDMLHKDLYENTEKSVRGEALYVKTIRQESEEASPTAKSTNDERARIVALLSECGGNYGLVAARMRVHRSTLYRKIKKYGIKVTAL